MKAGCPEIAELERHIAGDLSDEQQRSVEDHVSDCRRCASRLEEISENLDALGSVREALSDTDAEPPAPERIGSFAIRHEIARGGMGVVYLAEQERPQRLVALKVLRPGVTSPETLRRFELEAEVLARLTHAGIATVYEAGTTTLTTPAGSECVPYIAMEYIEGERLDRHADAHDLSIHQRLELVACIADAVHHAHVKGLVHRDLKPGNILVPSATPSTDSDSSSGRATAPKVVDFGIARIADAAGTLQTSTGQILGTVPYMSPEQLSGDPSAVDARSDVYSLGVVTFELLTGELPHDVKRVPIAEAARRIRDEAPRIAARLDRRLAGDPTTILQKALEADPAARYASAAEMAADIRRYLNHEPIQARPQTAWYQIRRFARRNRALTATSAGLALLLVGSAVAGSALATRAARAERRAGEQLIEARRQAERFETVSVFLEEMLSAASPEDHPGSADVTVREALATGVARLDDGSLADQPEIELGVRTTIGNTYRALGEFEEARAQLERATAIGRDLYPDGHADLAHALNKLARVADELNDRERAEALFRECLEMRERLHGRRSGEYASTLNNLAALRTSLGDHDSALPMHEEALAIRRELFGPTHEDIANSLNNLAVLHIDRSEWEQAEGLLRESLEMDRAMRGELHAHVASTMNNLAFVLARRGEIDEAESLQRRALELQRRIFGPDHPGLADSLLNLARLLMDRQRLDEAEPLFEEALTTVRQSRGRHPALANVLGNYAIFHRARRDFDSAETALEEALSIRVETLGDTHVSALGTRLMLARVARERGHREVSRRRYAQLTGDARAHLPVDSRLRFAILAEYGLWLAELGSDGSARDLLRDAREVGVAAGAAGSPRFTAIEEALERLGSVAD